MSAMQAEMARRAEALRQRKPAQAASGEPAHVMLAASDPVPSAAIMARPGGALIRSGRSQVDGGQALAYARQFLGHFAIWPSDAVLTTCTLWAGHCWARDAGKTLVFQSTPRLLFSSAQPGSGKSAAMKLVSRLCPSPALFTEPSEPAVAHSIGDHKTLFLDEIDVLFGTNGTRKSAIRAVINDGYTPDGKWPRVRNGVTHEMPTFGPLAMAGLDKVEAGTSGVMAATLSRCIRVRMVRAPEDYRPPRYDPQARMAATLIGERLGAWCQQELGALASWIPPLPDGIGNRDAELWEPLLTIADVAGGQWPQLARDAAEELIATGGMPPEDEDKAAMLDQLMAGLGAGEEF